MAKDAAKNAAKQAGKAVGKVIGMIGKKLLAFLLANPWVLLILGIAIVVILIILIVAGDTGGENKRFGLYGYDYFQVENICDTVKVYNPDTDTYTSELDFETEYIPGVVYAEVGLFSDAPEVLKLFAVAARSYALMRTL